MRIEFGRCNLDSCLTLAGMTRADLTEKTGYSRQHLAKFTAKIVVGKRRRIMSAETLLTIARAIGCEPEALYEIIFKPNPIVQKRHTKKTEI